LGKSWIGAEMGLLMGFAAFLIDLLLFFGIIILLSQRHRSERLRQYAKLRREQAYDFKEEDEL
jgi:hypothetical protein